MPRLIYMLFMTLTAFSFSAVAASDIETVNYKYSIGAIVRTLQLQHSYVLKPIESKKSRASQREDEDMMIFCYLCVGVKEALKLPGRAIMAMMSEPKEKIVLLPSFEVSSSALQRSIQEEGMDGLINIPESKYGNTIENRYGKLFDNLDMVLKPIRDGFHNFNIQSFQEEISRLNSTNEIAATLEYKIQLLESDVLRKENDDVLETFKSLKNRLAGLKSAILASRNVKPFEAVSYVGKELSVEFRNINEKVQAGEICIDYSRLKVRNRLMTLNQNVAYELTRNDIEARQKKYSSSEPEGRAYNLTQNALMAPGDFIGSLLFKANALATAAIIVATGTTDLAGSSPRVDANGFENAAANLEGSFRLAGGVLEFVFNGKE